MATIIGRLAKVAVSTDDITYNDLGKLQTATLSMTDDLADETTNDSNGYKEEKLADQQASVDFSCKYDISDTAQGQIITAKTGRTTIYVRVRPQETAGEKEYKFLANVPDLTVDFATGEVEDFSGTFQSTGTITTATQT